MASRKLRTMELRANYATRKSPGYPIQMNKSSHHYINHAVPLTATISKRNSNQESLTGFSHTFRLFDSKGKLWYRLLWATVLTISVGACVFQVLDRLIYLLSYPISTDTIFVFNKTVKYPSFTVCPDMYAHHPKLFEMLKPLANKLSQNICNMQNTMLVDHGIMNYSTFWEYTNVENLQLYGTLYSHTFIDVLKNVTVNKKIVKSASSSCIKYTIPNMCPFVGQDVVFVITFVSQNPHCPAQKSLLSIYMHDDNVDPKYRVLMQATRIGTNTLYNLRLKTKQYQFLDTSRNPCTDAETHESCYNKCVETLLRKRLRCRSPGLDLPTVRVCSNMTDVNENLSIFTSVMAVTDARDDCGCPRKCAETIYDIELHVVDVNNRLTIVAASHASNAFEIVTERRAYTLVSFICDAGGNCGLFLGLCVLSVFDSLEKFAVYLKYYISKSSVK